ncbi:MAG: NAD-dependent epimerase/dehydratase family protein [Balneolaceae bacterium]|nr:MAG: NAD-dependent epimerase/dehydratase family protein [Balneolaceae bacterium]
MNISVLGCGWLGFPLGQRLHAHNYSIKGSTTTESKLRTLEQNGIEPFLISLPGSVNDETIIPFWQSDLLILNVPPRLAKGEADGDFVQTVEQIIQKCRLHNLPWIIFTSSTSVYSETGGITKEEHTKPGSASRPAGEELLKAEELIRNSGIDYTILRLGGLYGYGRHPVKYLSGKKDLDGASKPVNLVHQTDCVNVICEVIRQKKRNEIYNVVSDGHPPRKEFYQSAAEHFNLPKPHFRQSNGKEYRVVSNQKLREELLYDFSYPNPMDHTP